MEEDISEHVLSNDSCSLAARTHCSRISWPAQWKVTSLQHHWRWRVFLTKETVKKQKNKPKKSLAVNTSQIYITFSKKRIPYLLLKNKSLECSLKNNIKWNDTQYPERRQLRFQIICGSHLWIRWAPNVNQLFHMNSLSTMYNIIWNVLQCSLAPSMNSSSYQVGQSDILMTRREWGGSQAGLDKTWSCTTFSWEH